MGEYKCQLLVEIWPFDNCQLTILYIFDAKLSLKGTYNVNKTLNSKTDAIVP